MTKRRGECALCAYRNGEGPQLECRRYPPTMLIAGAVQGIAGQRMQLMPVIPVVAPDFWCGEFVPGAPPSLKLA